MPRSPEDSADHRFEPEAVRVRAADGAQADLVVVDPASASHGVIWLPALGVSARHYQAFAMALADVGVASAIHEWRGTGSSTVRASRTCDWGYRELLELDIRASVDAARSARPGLRWVIAGHSLGGQLACLFAALNPGAVEGLAIVASGTPYWRTFDGLQAGLLRAVPFVLPAVTALCGYYPGKRLGFAGNEARRLMRDWARTIKAGQYSSHAPDRDCELALTRYSAPVLGIRLSEDRLCPAASFDWLLSKLSNAATRRVVLSAADFPSGKASHFSWMKEPAPVAAAMVRWLHDCDLSTSVT